MVMSMPRWRLALTFVAGGVLLAATGWAQPASAAPAAPASAA